MTIVAGAGTAAADALPPDANKTCPVMTDQPAKGDRFVDYGGKRVYLCCDKCVRKFAADPARYVGNVTSLVAPSGTPAQPAEPTGSRSMAATIVALFGRLHVAVVHFPIALLVLAAGIEAFRFRRRGCQPADAAYICLAIGSAAAVVAAGMGWALARETFAGEDGRTLGLHRWLGMAVAAGSVVAFLVASASRRKQSAALLYGYHGALLVCAALVGVVGHLGGTLTYGDDYFASAFGQSHVGPVASGSERPEVSATAATQPTVNDAADGTVQKLLFGTDAEIRAARIEARLAFVPKPPAPPVVDGPVLNDVDRFVFAKWREAKLREATTPPPVCDDATFLRRVYLDATGVIPTAKEVRKFLEDKSPDKRERLVDELLARSDAYAAHWTPFFEDGIASTPTELIGGIPTHGNYQAWIYESFKANKPYDVMVEELLDPTNSNYQRKLSTIVQGVQKQRGYVMNTDHKSTLATASNVGQFFLGTGMKCASCHSHFLNPDEWPQTKFTAFAGMFASKDLELIRCETSSGKFIPAGFPFKAPGVPATMPSDVNQRLHLVAKLITDPANPRFAKTLVNRLWKKYLGLGLFEPADDWREDAPPTNPELLNWLAYDFAEHGYDVKRTVRMILTSRTYQLRYDPNLEDHFDLAKRNEPRYYRSPSLRRMTYEQLLDSVRLATSQNLDDKTRLYHNNESTSLTRALGKPANRSEISTARADDVAIVQSLELLNGEEWSNLAYHNPLIDELAKEADPAKVAGRLFEAVLSRPPDKAELSTAAEFLATSNLPKATDTRKDVIVLEDAPPAGAKLNGTGGAKAWRFVTKPDPVFSGSSAHVQTAEDGKSVQHGYTRGMPVELASEEDVLYSYVYLDPSTPPKEVMLQWNDGQGSEHRAYWGENLIALGADGTPSRYNVGKLPKAGKWVRLGVPAKYVGLTRGSKVSGMSFDQNSGRVYWDKAGIQTKPGADAPAIGDLLWALFTTPEFQYTR